jgi:cell division protein FtsN
MAHDFAKTRYKERHESAPPTPPQPNKGMLMTGVVTGLALGFFASFLIYLSGVLPPVSNSDPQVEADNAASMLAAQQRRNDELEQAAARLQLEFYKELPNYEVIVDNMPTSTPTRINPPTTTGSDTAIAPSTSALPPSTTPQTQASYMIQAGAFQQEASAHAQSARLTALGLEARIKKEALLGKTLFLVQTGPYSTRDQVAQAERLLRSASIDSIRIGLNQ